MRYHPKEEKKKLNPQQMDHMIGYRPSLLSSLTAYSFIAQKPHLIEAKLGHKPHKKNQ